MITLEEIAKRLERLERATLLNKAVLDVKEAAMLTGYSVKYMRLLIAQLFHAPDQELDGVAVPANERRSIEPALQYVSENYTQEVRMADMAASCAMSESYFRKVFSRIMGMPPLEYVNRYRINRSINLLRFTDETVQSIAGRTGFPSIATYNRNFHRYVGLSPAQWRKNAHE